MEVVWQNNQYYLFQGDWEAYPFLEQLKYSQTLAVWGMNDINIYSQIMDS